MRKVFCKAAVSVLFFSCVTGSGAWAADKVYTYTPLPPQVRVNEPKAELGGKLYHDRALSTDGKISCASCHDLKKGGSDQLPLSPGVMGQMSKVNSPTVYNSDRNFVQFWNGRAANLNAQALYALVQEMENDDVKKRGEEPSIHGDGKMVAKWHNLVERVKANKDYVTAFGKLYQGKISEETIADAIAEFEKTLITPDSRFDDFLRGDEQALNEQEKRGFALFKTKGCANCHSGNYFGGESYQALNQDYFKDRGGKVSESDMGRYSATRLEEDKYRFKVPMLRNVGVTAPYFHDGKVPTLEEAVRKMGKYQLGTNLKPEEVQAISAFLKTLTGKYKGVPLDKMK
ncbi:c-type cytochrome [bacterium]|nr:c-type cytochrome [bacterium]